MQFNLGFEVPPPHDAILAEHIDSYRSRYLTEKLSELVSEVVVQELVNEAERAGNMHKLNVQLSHGDPNSQKNGRKLGLITRFFRRVRQRDEEFQSMNLEN